MNGFSGWVDNSKHNKFFQNGKGAAEETILEQFYRRMLTEISMSRFKWSGLPKEIDHRFLEKTLFYNGLAIFFHDDRYNKFFALQGTPAGTMDEYDNPTRFQTHANFMQPRILRHHSSDTLKECVPIWSNYMRMPQSDVVSIYARRLARLDRTIDINVSSARNPRIFKGTENLRLSAMNVHKQIDSGADFLQITDSLADAIDTLDMGIDVNGFEKLHVLRARMYNECMGFMGIDNANSEKRERLVEGELEANEEQTDLSRAVAMNAREEAADEINRIYGLNVSVEYRGTDASIGMQTSADIMDGGENG